MIWLCLRKDAPWIIFLMVDICCGKPPALFQLIPTLTSNDIQMCYLPRAGFIQTKDCHVQHRSSYLLCLVLYKPIPLSSASLADPCAWFLPISPYTSLNPISFYSWNTSPAPPHANTAITDSYRFWGKKGPQSPELQRTRGDQSTSRHWQCGVPTGREEQWGKR